MVKKIWVKIKKNKKKPFFTRQSMKNRVKCDIVMNTKSS